MNYNNYDVEINGKTYNVRCFNESQAIILAQAEAIKEGRDHTYIGEVNKVNPNRGFMFAMK